MIKLDKHGILVRSRTPAERVLADTPLVILPQLFHMEVMLAAHDRQGHQGHHRVTAHIQTRLARNTRSSEEVCRSVLELSAEEGATAIRHFPLLSIGSASPMNYYK